MYLNVELRQMRYVIAVADELHFGRAAHRLHLAPPSLSKQIRQLEAVLGYRLFERKTHQVILTSAGAAFVAEGRLSLDHAKRAVERARAADREETGVLNIGYTPWFDPSLLPPLRTAFLKQSPDSQITFHSLYTTAQLAHLERGDLEAGMIVLPCLAEGLSVRRIWRDRLSLAVPENHHLARCDGIALKDVQEEPVVWMVRLLNPLLNDHLLTSCREQGWVPNIVHEVTTVTEALSLVASRVGVAFVKASVSETLQQKGVVFRNLAEPDLVVETAIAHRADHRSESIQILVRLLLERSNCGGE